jgi:sugar lactone lactonase YvrE
MKGEDVKRAIRRASRRVVLVVLCACCFPLCHADAADTVDFESDYWIFKNAEVKEHLGRTCLHGYALLKDVLFENGVIEVDLAVTGASSYPGFVFRAQSDRDYERIYLRPHRAGLYPDAVQYTPVFNGIAGWQLYNGRGYTSGVELPPGQWIHLKLEISGTQAKLYVADMDTPVLEMHDLERGAGSGAIGLFGPRDGNYYFSNFSYRHDDGLAFEPPPPVDAPPGVITEWELSEPFRLSRIDVERYPGKEWLEGLSWERVGSEPSGLVDVGRYHGRTGREPDIVFARKIIQSDRESVLKLMFGYSDAISIFMNGRLIFSGSSAYRQRDPSFLGVVGLYDMVYLPLEKGGNELLFMVVESFGGWAFMGRDQDAVYRHASLSEAWRSEKEFLIPETVTYDPKRKVFYVSNYDIYNFSFTGGLQHISKVSPEGKVLEARWVEGLSNPTGMAMREDRLFVVERAGVVEIDPSGGGVVKRYPVPGARFLNDIAIDGEGRVYVSDSRGGVIFRLEGDGIEQWLSGDLVDQPNGLHVLEGKLIVADNGDGTIRAFDLETKDMSVLALIPGGGLDGIEEEGNGSLLVSHYEGRLFRVSMDGTVEKLLDTTGPGMRCANFAHVPESNLLAVPTFEDNRIVLYRLGD